MLTRVPLAVLVVLTLAGCNSSPYFSAWEKLGWAKRDILVSRVKEARDEQEGAKNEFKSTLAEFRSVAGIKDDELQPKYDKLKADYDRCETRAAAVKKRIDSVDGVAEAMFSEWKKELSEYESAELRHSSERQLDAAKDRYAQLIAAMRRAESKMHPVLRAFHDQVLFLKHNLNARAIASLDQTRVQVESDVASLIAEMEASIKEANSFISEMQKQTK